MKCGSGRLEERRTYRVGSEECGVVAAFRPCILPYKSGTMAGHERTTGEKRRETWKMFESSCRVCGLQPC